MFNNTSHKTSDSSDLFALQMGLASATALLTCAVCFLIRYCYFLQVDKKLIKEQEESVNLSRFNI